MLEEWFIIAEGAYDPCFETVFKELALIGIAE